MTPDLLFQIANPLALIGWLALLASPLRPRAMQAIAAAIVPLMLSCLYLALVMVFWSRAQGGFGSLADVEKLFETRELLLAGWVHYLAFDLFVGAWATRTAREEGIPFLLVLPCLGFTFLFGPVGFLLFSALRLARRVIARPSNTIPEQAA